MVKSKNTSDNINGRKRPAVTIFLVMIESALSVALRLDKGLRQKVYPLVQANMRWSIRTYLPHVMIYVSFTPNGILLDSKPAEDEGEPDVIISGSLIAVFRSVISSDERTVSKLQFRGNTDDVGMSREFIANLGLQHIASNLFGKLRQVSNVTEEPSEKKLIANYKSQLDEQQSTIDTLSGELERANQLVTKQKRNTGIFAMLFGMMAVTSMVLLYILYA